MADERIPESSVLANMSPGDTHVDFSRQAAVIPKIWATDVKAIWGKGLDAAGRPWLVIADKNDTHGSDPTAEVCHPPQRSAEEMTAWLEGFAAAIKAMNDSRPVNPLLARATS